MKFIIDAQLPISLSFLLRHKGFDTIHTLELNNKNKTGDIEIIAISKTQNRIVITKDNDFLESFLVNRKPEKLILVRTGNISNKDLSELFLKNIDKITQLFATNDLIEINKNEIIVHV